MFWKSLAVVWVLICCLCSANVYATPQEFSAKGEYRLGDRDNRETAKMAALAEAKRKIIEQAGVYIETYSELNDFELTKEQIKSAANAMIKIKSEDISFSENGTLCTAFVTALVDTADIEDLIRNWNITPKVKQTKNVKPADEKFLKLAGIEEYKGHYYKVFNDGLTWAQAKQRCEEIGGHLVAITSQMEQAIITELIISQGTKGFYWTGGVKDSKRNFTWITGEKFSYSNWANGEPNNAGGIENIVTVFKYQGLNGFWNDLSELGDKSGKWPFYNIKNSGFVCEWDSFEAIKL